MIRDSSPSILRRPISSRQWCQRVHGISESDTEDAPVFSKVWQQLEERIVEIFFSNQDLDDVRYQIATIPFVAHNARFDESCLKAVFRVYQMDYPDYRFYDTLTASRRQFGRSLPNHQLQTVAAACGYNLENHHHALKLEHKLQVPCMKSASENSYSNSAIVNYLQNDNSRWRMT